MTDPTVARCRTVLYELRCADGTIVSARHAARAQARAADRDLEMRQLLLSLEMVSHGSTQAWNSSGGHSGEPDDKLVDLIVAKPGDPPHLTFRRRYDRAPDDATRELVIEAARTELEQITGRNVIRIQPSLSDREILEQDILKAVGWSADEVALQLRCRVSLVRNIRIANGRHAETGIEVILDLSDDQRERVIQLHAQGCPERQIRDITGLSKTTVRRVLGKAA